MIGIVTLIITVLRISVVGSVKSIVNEECKLVYWNEIIALEVKIREQQSVFRDVKGAPFCVNKNHRSLEGFEDLFHYSEIAKTKIHSLTDDFDMEVLRITVPDASMYNLRNWAHLVIISKGKLEVSHMIMQAVSSPLGIPFGEFVPEVIGNDRLRGTVYHDQRQADLKLRKVVPCKYRPRASIRNPQAFVIIKNKDKQDKSYNHVHVSFNWIDVTCHEVTALQFIILASLRNPATKLRGIKRLYLSPVYYLDKKDFGVGSPFPYYAQWKALTNAHGVPTPCKNDLMCRAKPEIIDPLPWRMAPGKLRVIYNKDYNNCILKDIGLDKKTQSCPPGPFYCSENRAAAAEENKKLGIPGIALESTVEEYKLAMTKAWGACGYFEDDCSTKFFEKLLFERCYAAFPWSEVFLPDPEEVEDVFDEEETAVEEMLKERLKQQQRIDLSGHGALMITAFFIFIPISNFMARFLKETGGASEDRENGCCNIRLWLWGHIVISFLSVFLIWMGILLPSLDTMDCVKPLDARHPDNVEKCSETPHVAVSVHVELGWIVFTLVHVNFLCGWIRPLNRHTRLCLTIFHSISGHLFLFIAFEVIVTHTRICGLVVFVLLCVIILNLILSGVATGIQFFKDKASHLEPKRRLCPIFEFVEQHDCKCGLICQLVIHCVIHIFALLIVLNHYQAQLMFCPSSCSSGLTAKCVDAIF